MTSFTPILAFLQVLCIEILRAKNGGDGLSTEGTENMKKCENAARISPGWNTESLRAKDLARKRWTEEPFRREDRNHNHNQGGKFQCRTLLRKI